MTRGRTFDELQLGTKLTGAVTVTATHVATAAGLFGDYNPLHVNDEVARQSVFGRRIVHGPLTVGLMMASLGMETVGTGVALLENVIRYRHPAFIGDTLSWEWEVTERRPNAKYHGGIVFLTGKCWNQEGATIVEAMATQIVSNHHHGAPEETGGA
jgi:acyl dehydratase